MSATALLDEVKRIKAIADIGLLYCNNEYDRERYTELHKICFRMLNYITGYEKDRLLKIFPSHADYPTAKVDIRGLLLSADNAQILLVREGVDGKWSLPGGWADIGFTPAETVVKEFKEETGVDVIPEKLLAVFDKRLHDHPPEAFYVYKMVFWCKPVSANIQKGFDIMDVRYFNLDDLPPLSENRILKSQINLLYNKITASDYETYFD